MGTVALIACTGAVASAGNALIYGSSAALAWAAATVPACIIVVLAWVLDPGYLRWRIVGLSAVVTLGVVLTNVAVLANDEGVTSGAIFGGFLAVIVWVGISLGLWEESEH